MEKIELLNIIKTQFSDSELRDLCFKLGIDYESLPAMGKGDKARELILYLDRRERISELLNICQHLRPDVSWSPSQEILPKSCKSAKVKILFLAANSLDSTRLRLDVEIREIKETLQRTEFRDRFEIEQYWAVRVIDLQSYLLRHKPDIVHFSGHGSKLSEIILEADFGNSHPVSIRALSQLFSLLKDNIRCVVLNACYSETQARAMAEHIDCVIGMSKGIKDLAAIRFATAFYQALGFGKDIKTAFNLGCVEIDLENLDAQDTPKLLALKSDPKGIVFVHNV